MSGIDAVEALDVLPPDHCHGERKEFVPGHRHKGCEYPVDVELRLGLSVLVTQGGDCLRIHPHLSPVGKARSRHRPHTGLSTRGWLRRREYMVAPLGRRRRPATGGLRHFRVDLQSPLVFAPCLHD